MSEFRPSALVFAALLLNATTSVQAAELYVSPAGNDANPGTQAKPFATLQAAVNVLQPGDTLLIRAGTYRETVILPRSGTPQQPITIKACGGEKVVVSGCEPLAGWTLHDAEKKVWKTPMPWTLGPGRNQVFCDTRVMIEARYPNAAARGLEDSSGRITNPSYGLEMAVADLSPLWPTYGEFSIPQETRVSQPGRVVSKLLDNQPDDYWKGGLYCGVHFEGWCAQTGVIERSKAGEIHVGDRTQGWWFGAAYDGMFPQAHEEGRGMIVGHIHALDAPGEWHWQDNTLYAIAPDGGQPKTIEAKRRQLAFDLSGRRHIRIEGLAVHAASMRLEDSADCIVDRCELAYIAHYTHHLAMGQITKGRDTIKSGETGIYVSGRDNTFLNCGVRFSAGAGFYLRGYHHTIHNCLIDEVSYVGHYLNAITDAVGDFGAYENQLVGGHVVTFNTMRNAGRHFFNFSGNGTSLASRDRGPMDYAATLFAHNHLYNGMLLTRDAGFLTGYFGSGGSLNGLRSQVAYNVMHDCYDLSAIRWNKLGMIYLDEGTCQVDVHHNLFWAAPGSLQRDMWFNTCCVGVREHDNVFHGLFTRSCGKLRAEEFPGGRPFRFGHDPADPPPLPPWPPIVSRQLDWRQRNEGRRAPKDLKDGDRIALDGADFGDGWRSAVLSFSSPRRELNTDRTSRTPPRHRHATDPLVLEAKHHDGTAEKMRMQWTFFYNVEDGAWLRYQRVPLGEGYRRIRAVYGNDRPELRRLEVRLDRVDGPLAGSLELAQTDRPRAGHVQIYGEAVGELSPQAHGMHDVYLVFRSPAGSPSVDFEYFRFEQYRGEVPLQKNEVKLELRASDPGGPKLGEFYPRGTGGADNVREFVASLEPGPKPGPLFLAVRSAVSGPIGTVHGIRLEKSSQPADACYQPPPGRATLPQPTHRPRSSPADRYRQPLATRPFHRATRLAAPPPVVDGNLNEWTAKAIELSQSLEGIAAEGPAAQAWIGYNEQALYVAMRVPQGPSPSPLAAGRLWGATDGVELAIQNAEATPPGPIVILRGWPDGFSSSPEVAGINEAMRRRLADSVAYRAVTANDAWTCEWRIPFAVCGGVPALLNANLTVRAARENRWLTWNMDSGATYDLHNGGTILFDARETLLTAGLRQSLEVWLDASDAASIEKDAAGAVRMWKDRSGKGRHAVQNQADFQPRLSPRGLSGKPSLQFDDAKRTRMDVPDLSSQPMTVTVFAVVSNPESVSPKSPHPRVFTASNGKEYDYLCGINCAIPGLQTGGPRQLLFEGKDRWAKQVRVGCFSPNYQTFFKGQVAEILVFGKALTAEERFRVTAYLAAKWEL